MNSQVVIFKADGNATILHVSDPTSYKNRPDCLINPKIPKGVPPHHWKLLDGKIVTLSEKEKKQKTEMITKIVLPNSLSMSIQQSSFRKKEGLTKPILISVFTAIIVSAIFHFWIH